LIPRVVARLIISLAIIIVWFIIPETKGVALEIWMCGLDIDVYLRKET
jgi:hypothetical protein